MAGRIRKNIKKDFLVEFRNRSAVNISFAFAGITTLAISLVAGGIPLDDKINSILLWMIIFFSGMNGLAHIFIRETEEKNALLLRITDSPEDIYISKLLFNIVFFWGITAIICPLYFFFLQVFPLKIFLFILTAASGSLAISAVTTILGAMVSIAGGKGSLFTVISFPLLLPVLWISISLTAASFDAVTAPEYRNVFFLLAFSGVITSVSYLLFRYIWVE